MELTDTIEGNKYEWHYYQNKDECTFYLVAYDNQGNTITEYHGGVENSARCQVE
jgi:hypothetical protein